MTGTWLNSCMSHQAPAIPLSARTRLVHHMASFNAHDHEGSMAEPCSDRLHALPLHVRAGISLIRLSMSSSLVNLGLDCHGARVCLFRRFKIFCETFRLRGRELNKIGMPCMLPVTHTTSQLLYDHVCCHVACCTPRVERAVVIMADQLTKEWNGTQCHRTGPSSAPLVQVLMHQHNLSAQLNLHQAPPSQVCTGFHWLWVGMQVSTLLQEGATGVIGSTPVSDSTGGSAS